jgi:hypothetical protein
LKILKLKKKLFLSFKFSTQGESTPYNRRTGLRLQSAGAPRRIYGYIRIPVHSRDFQEFSDFPIFGLFAGHKTHIYGYIRIPVHSRDFQEFSDFPIFGLFAGHKTRRYAPAL